MGQNGGETPKAVQMHAISLSPIIIGHRLSPLISMPTLKRRSVRISPRHLSHGCIPRTFVMVNLNHVCAEIEAPKSVVLEVNQTSWCDLQTRDYRRLRSKRLCMPRLNIWQSNDFGTNLPECRQQHDRPIKDKKGRFLIDRCGLAPTPRLMNTIGR